MGMYKKMALIGMLFCLFKDAVGAFSGDEKQRNFLRLTQLSNRMQKLEKEAFDEKKEREQLWKELYTLHDMQCHLRLSVKILWHGIGLLDNRIDLLKREADLLRQEISLKKKELVLLEQSFFGTDVDSQEAISGSRPISSDLEESKSPFLPPSIGFKKVI